jgi:spermidine synthase
MADIVPEGRACYDGQRAVAVEHFTVESVPLRAVFHPEERVEPGRYARLIVNGGVMMSDVQNEQATNLDAVLKARGDMLIAGLGLGMILVPILKNPKVTSVTVVEKNPAVILLVAQHISRLANGKLQVFQADIHDWRPASKGRQFDVIYFDIWGDQSTDDLDTMKVLHRQFRKYLRTGGWVSSWNYDDLRARKRRGGPW